MAMVYLRDWWTSEDRSKNLMYVKTQLAAQYDSYDVIDGLTINGQLTSGRKHR